MSLKECERKLRGADNRPFLITGPQQALKQGCQKLLQNGIFKDQLAMFLLTEWQEDHYGPIIQNKTLTVSHGGNCIRLTFNELDLKMCVGHPVHLQGSLEEADTLLAFHASSVTGNAVIRASDTDVLGIMLGMIGWHMTSDRATPYSHIIMDCGSGNSRRYIDVSNIAIALESKQKGLAAAMPGLHAFTGSDFTTAFYRKGKVKPLEVLEKDTEGTLIWFFGRLTSEDQPDQSKAEEFICSLYGIKGDMKGDVKDVNQARHLKLCHMTGKMDKENPMSHVKKVDCALLPPCAKTVHNKLQRAHFISIIWGNADTPRPGHGLDPLNYGWKEQNGYYTPDWFVGPAMPDYLFEEGEQEEESMEDIQCNQPDVAPMFDDDDGSHSENAWSDDSEIETEI